MDVTTAISTLESQKVLKVTDYRIIDRDHVSNKLYVLVDDTGTKYVLKIYHIDERKRLEREYGAYTFYKKLGSGYTPTPVYKNLEGYFALYTFLHGHHIKPSMATKFHLKSLADYLLYTQKNSRKAKNYGLSFEAEVSPAFSFSQTIDKIYNKTNKFLSDPEIERNEIIRDFKSRYDFIALMSSYIAVIVDGLSQEERSTPIPQEWRMLSIGDLHFGNVLFHNRQMHIVDFDDFGWDDPVSLISYFINHMNTIGLSDLNKNYFLTYLEENWDNDYKDFKTRLSISIQLGAVLWLSSYLLALTSHRIKLTSFADPKLNVDEYVVQKVDLFEKKLQELSAIKA